MTIKFLGCGFHVIRLHSIYDVGIWIFNRYYTFDIRRKRP